MDSIKTQLMSMGFSEDKVAKAMESCPEAQTLEQIMEWLIAHDDELNNPTPQYTTQSSSDSKKNDNESDKKKLSVDEAQRLIVERQAKRLEEERKREIEDEKRRRDDGKKILQTRQEIEDQERIRVAQQIRQEKMEKELHRKKVLDQIARDREAMKERNSRSAADSSQATNLASDKQVGSKQSVTQAIPSRPMEECRIALRFPDGSNIIHKFGPQEQLSAVRLFVQMSKGSSAQIEFVAPPNKKLSDPEMGETLEKLGLCPASRLEVRYKAQIWEDLD